MGLVLSRLLPPLARRHLNFFIAATGLALFHLWFGVTQLFDPGRYSLSVHDRFYDYVSLEVWGVINLIVWAAMTTGTWTDRWWITRVGIGIGLAWSLTRLFLFEVTVSGPVGGAFGFYFLVIVMHYVQIAEPPKTPLYLPDDEA